MNEYILWKRQSISRPNYCRNHVWWSNLYRIRSGCIQLLRRWGEARLRTRSVDQRLRIWFARWVSKALSDIINTMVAVAAPWYLRGGGGSLPGSEKQKQQQQQQQQQPRKVCTSDSPPPPPPKKKKKKKKKKNQKKKIILTGGKKGFDGGEGKCPMPPPFFPLLYESIIKNIYFQ